jgi:hypothetical protein
MVKVFMPGYYRTADRNTSRFFRCLLDQAKGELKPSQDDGATTITPAENSKRPNERLRKVGENFGKVKQGQGRLFEPAWLLPPLWEGVKRGSFAATNL